VCKAIIQRFQIGDGAGRVLERVGRGGGIRACETDRFGLIGSRSRAMNGYGLERLRHANA